VRRGASMAVQYECCDVEFSKRVLIIVVLVMFAGLMSGLTLGLMSLSLVDLEVLAKSGTPHDRYNAGEISLLALWETQHKVSFNVGTSLFLVFEFVFCHHSKDIACCQESTFVALHPSNLQRGSHGGTTKIMC